MQPARLLDQLLERLVHNAAVQSDRVLRAIGCNRLFGSSTMCSSTAENI